MVSDNMEEIGCGHLKQIGVKILIADPGLRARYGEASRRMAVDEFSEQRIVEAHLDLYERLGALSSGGRADR